MHGWDWGWCSARRFQAKAYFPEDQTNCIATRQARVAWTSRYSDVTQVSPGPP
jgi:hypothetical protein